MGLTREVSAGGRVNWRRVERPPPEKDRIEQIVALVSENAAQLPTEEKRIWLYDKFATMKSEVDREPIIILVERENFLRDSMEQFRTVSDFDLRKEIKVHFINEMAQDAGGLIREWFSVLLEELLNPSLGLFQRAGTAELAYVINEYSGNVQPKHLDYFFFCGQILAKAVFERIPVKGFLGRPILKQLLGRKVAVEDLRDYDTELWNSISFIAHTQIQKEQAISTFAVRKVEPRSHKEVLVELKQRGKDITLDDGNKDEFIRLFVEYHLIKKTQTQQERLTKGFASLIPGKVISVLDVDELEFFLCGDSEIDIDDWRQNTVYKGDYTEDSNVIIWLWSTLKKMDERYRRKFLQFCTGSTRVPVEGFRGLMSNSGKVCKFCIEPREYHGPDTAFVVAHTCFNRIELPDYPSLEIMEENIRRILDDPECCTFAFE